MKLLHPNLLLTSALFVSLVSLVSLVACSSEEAAAPSRPPGPPPVTAPPAGGGPGADGGPRTSDCFDTTKDEPVEQKDFLNQCNSAECFAFDNGGRIEGYTAGAPLPPLN